jgi:hypothetical protein
LQKNHEKSKNKFKCQRFFFLNFFIKKFKLEK